MKITFLSVVIWSVLLGSLFWLQLRINYALEDGYADGYQARIDYEKGK